MNFSNSFKIRTKVSIGIVLIVIIGALTPDMLGLRLVYILAAFISVLEVYTLAPPDQEISLRLRLHRAVSLAILGFSAIAVYYMPSVMLIIGIILTMASDVGAYLTGKLCGMKFTSSRPFPTISPNKSWEGIVGGIVIPGLMILPIDFFFRNSLPGQPLPTIAGCLVGLCAIIGDASESLLKRQHGAKDTNDVLKKSSFFRPIEALLGGSEGHGGYYDRLDSMSLVLLLLGSLQFFCTSP